MAGRAPRARAELLVGLYRKGAGEPTISLAAARRRGALRRLDRRRAPRHRRALVLDPDHAPQGALQLERDQRSPLRRPRRAGPRRCPRGRAAWERREEARTAIYSYEREPAAFDAEQEARFRAAPAAWKFFSEVAPSYRRTSRRTGWSVRNGPRPASALAQLIEDSAAGRRLKHLSPAREMSR